MECWLARRCNLVGRSARASSGQGLVSGELLRAWTPNDCLGLNIQQAPKFLNPISQQSKSPPPFTPCGWGCAQEPSWSGWPQGLRKSAFGCWFGCASLDGMGRPLDPSRLGFGSCAPPPMASILRKQSLSRFSSELLDELSYCCQMAANPCLRLGALADEILMDRIRELPEPELDPEILALLPY